MTRDDAFRIVEAELTFQVRRLRSQTRPGDLNEKEHLTDLLAGYAQALGLVQEDVPSAQRNGDGPVTRDLRDIVQALRDVEADMELNAEHLLSKGYGDARVYQEAVTERVAWARRVVRLLDAKKYLGILRRYQEGRIEREGVRIGADPSAPYYDED